MYFLEYSKYHHVYSGSLLFGLGFRHVFPITVRHILGLQPGINPFGNGNGLKILPKQVNGIVLSALQQLGSLLLTERHKDTAL